MPFSPQGGNGTVLVSSDVVAGSANFEDRSLWKYNALSLKNHNLIAVPSGSTENRYGVEPLTDSSCPYFSRVKSRISYGQYILGKPANGMSNRAIYQPATP